MLAVSAGSATTSPSRVIGDDDLAAEARGPGQPEREIEHVFLVLAHRLQLAEPGGIDDDVTGRAGHRALARALDVDAVAERDLQHGVADRRRDLVAGAVGVDEGHGGHGSAAT